jgi:hypothetical protein
MKDPSEELNRIKLKPLYLFLALECFRNDKRTAILRCDEIKDFFGLEVLRHERVTWMHRDSYEFFPYLYHIEIEDSSDLIALSRMKFIESNVGMSGDPKSRYCFVRKSDSIAQEIIQDGIEIFSPYKGKSIKSMIESLILRSAGL